MQKVKIVILLFAIMTLSGCASSVEKNIVGKTYTGCDLVGCYIYIFEENHHGRKDYFEKFTYDIKGDEVTLYSDSWSNSPVKYKYDSETNCLSRVGLFRRICQRK